MIMTFTKILISSFNIEVEMQKLQEVKVEMALSTLHVTSFVGSDHELPWLVSNCKSQRLLFQVCGVEFICKTSKCIFLHF